MKNIFAEYDDTLREPPNKDAQDQLIKDAGWKRTKGQTVPGVFPDRPVGERLLSSCRWMTSKGILEPAYLFPVEFQQGSRLLHELLDVLWRNTLKPDRLVDALCLPLLLQYHEGIDHPVLWCQRAVEALNRVRPLYPEYLAAWDEPPEVQFRSYRPGWGPEPETPVGINTPLKWTVRAAR